MDNRIVTGHILALITVFIWGLTFISTKILLDYFSPIEILFYRFIIAWIILLIIAPRTLHIIHRKQEFLFAIAGLCGVTLYYLVENMALTYTLASNVGIISSAVPFVIALLSFFFLKEPLHLPFFIGFIVAMVGISFISLNGATHFQVNPFGDLLALCATVIWAIYSIVLRKISQFGYPLLLVTRRIFGYGILFMIPIIIMMPTEWHWNSILELKALLNLLFLGICASAICFITWNYAIQVLGTVTSGLYIYLVPVITVLFSVLLLQEPLTLFTVVGITLTLVGLFLSEAKWLLKKKI